MIPIEVAMMIEAMEKALENEEGMTDSMMLNIAYSIYEREQGIE